jgi:hypothetical protein
MATKRRSKSEEDDDDDPPTKRRRSRGAEDEDSRPGRRVSRDEDEDDEDEEPRPRRRMSRDDEDDEDEEPRPRRRVSRDEEDEDDPRPRRRKSRQADDEDDDDPRPPKRKPAEVEEIDEIDELDELDELDDLDEEADSYEAQLAAWNKKQALKRKQLITLSEGLETFRKQLRFYTLGLPGAAGAAAGLIVFDWWLELKMFDYIKYLAVGMFAALAIICSATQAQAVNMCKAGPPKSDPSGMLTATLVGAFASPLIFAGGIVYGLFIRPETALYVVAVFPATMPLSYIMEAVYLRNLARFFKDKPQAAAAQSVFLQLILVGYGGPCVLAVAWYFLVKASDIGTLGLILLGAIAVIWLLLVVKHYTEILGVVARVFTTVEKQIKAVDKPDW